MNYQNWKWCDTATEEQMDSESNTAAVNRLAAEARQLYDSIPEIRRRGGHEDYDDGPDFEFESDEDAKEYSERLRKNRVEAFGQLDAIESLMSVRGARFARPYEHWNEDEQLMEYLERDDQ